MQVNKKNLKSIGLTAFAVLAAYWGLQNLSLLASAAGWLLALVKPFVVGGAIAFVLNVPMHAIERHLFPKARKGAHLRRPLAFLLTLVLVLGVLVLASLVIVPNLGEALVSLPPQVTKATEALRGNLYTLADRWPELKQLVLSWEIDWAGVAGRAMGLLESLGNRLLGSGAGFVGGLVSGLATFFIGAVFAVYLLLQKEKLSRQGKICLYALLPEAAADRTVEILTLSGRIFSRFLSGQCLEAVILGSMFAVSMVLFRMPYPLLVGVVIALTALIPVIGSFIGCGVGVLLIAVADPWKALMFLILFLVLQQIEGNLIYPHVVGSSVGLPSIWVLVAVILGGSLMGVAGMVLFIPLCSVLYTLFRRFVKDRLAEKNIPKEKLNAGGDKP